MFSVSSQDKRPVAAILFDLDGTLVDAKEWHYEAFNKALRLFGFEISKKDHLSIYDGLPTRDKLKLLTEREGLPKTLYDPVFRFKQEFTFQEIIKNCKPVFSVTETLQRLRDRGYKLGLCSNAIRKSVDLMLHYSGISKYFELILSNQDVVFAKPDPEIYETARRMLKLKAENCIVVEDNLKGVEAGKRAGMKVLQVSSPEDISLELFKECI